MSLNAESVVEYERLHTEAMKLANDGFTHRYLGQHENAVAAFRGAWKLERDAAMLLLGEKELEPSRSISFRSAASLALLCGEHEDARKLAHLGLGGSPPPRVQRVLEAVLADAQQRLRSGAVEPVDSLVEELRRLAPDTDPPEPVDVTWRRVA